MIQERQRRRQDAGRLIEHLRAQRERERQQERQERAERRWAVIRERVGVALLGLSFLVGAIGVVWFILWLLVV